MTQKIEQHYGLHVQAMYDVDIRPYINACQEILTNARDSGATCNEQYAVYITQINFILKKEEVYKVKPLNQRLREMSIVIGINQREKEGNKMMFLNKLIPLRQWLLCENVEANAEMHKIAARILPSFFMKERIFTVLVITCIRKDVSERRRKLKIEALAIPTDNFSRKFFNTDGRMKTELDYLLDRRVQVSVDLP